MVVTCKKTLEICLQHGLSTDQVLTIAGNLTESEVQEKVVNDTVSHFGKLDILVNCAGIAREEKSLSTTSMEDFDLIIDLNLKSSLRLIQLGLPYLKLTKGNVVNVSSIASLVAVPAVTSYCVSKSGLDQVTRCGAKEFAEFGIRVNSVNPGYIQTKIHGDEEYLVGMEATVVETTPLGRWGQPLDVAKCIAFLASDDASFINGVHLLVDGGLYLN